MRRNSFTPQKRFTAKLTTPKQFVRECFQQASKAKQKFALLKINADQSFLIAVSKLLPSAPHLFHRLFFGTPVPVDYAELLKETQSFPGSLVQELQWVTTALLHYSTQLKAFFEAKAVFDNELLLGNYSVAKAILAEIENQHGVSIWGLGNSFLINDLSMGLEANTSFLSELNAREDVDVIIKILGHFLSMRAEGKLSHANYQRQLARYLVHFDEHPRLKSFFGQLLGSDAFEYNLEHFNAIFYDLTDASIIDRAIFVQKFITKAILVNPNEKEELQPFVELLQKHLGGEQLANISLVFGNNPGSRNDFDHEMIAALDCYTSGNYVAAADRGRELILNNPLVFQLYELYAKSMIFANQPFVSPFPENSLSARVLSAIDSIFRKSDKFTDSLDMLARASEWLYFTPLATGLRYIVASETRPDEVKMAERQALLDARFLNPRLAIVGTSVRECARIANTVTSIHPESVTAVFWKDMYNALENGGNPAFPKMVSQERRSLYTASILVERGEFSDAIPLLESLYAGRLQNTKVFQYPLYDQITGRLFYAYLKAGKITNALAVFVENYLHDPLITRSLSTEALRKEIEQNQDSELLRNIYVPIFYGAISTDPQLIYIAYDNYLTSCGYKTPSDFIRNASDVEPKLAIFFLDKVCTQKVMAASYHFTGTQALENERLFVCQHLCRIDPTNQAAIYSKEIDEITQRAFIRKGIQKVEEGKIFVDEAGIRKTGDKLLRESFKRYVDFSSLKGSAGLRLLDTSNTKWLSSKEPEPAAHGQVDIQKLEAEGVRVILKSHYALFKELFLDIRDRFISSSEYGLDS
ncbi:MAG: hypothetical protein WCD79_08010, partial [Chthoniobacteraceae bacterium]